jgi:hypothetical protein
MGRNRRKKECPSLYKTKGKRMPNREIILFEDCFANGFNESKIPGMYFPRAPGWCSVTYCSFRPRPNCSGPRLVIFGIIYIELGVDEIVGSLN